MRDVDQPAGYPESAVAKPRGADDHPGVAGPTAPPGTAGAGRLLLLLAYLAFVSIGLPDGLLGVGWPSIAADFGTPTEAVGLLLTAATTGYLTSSVLAGFSVARLGVGRLLAGSTALATTALAGYAVAPGFGLMVACGFLLGLGSGAIDSGLNVYAASAFGPRHMNWMHACFGLGVALGPLTMTAALGAGLAWRWGYGTVASAELLLAVAFVVTVGAWQDRRERRTGSVPRPRSSPEGARSDAVRVRDTLARPAVWFGMLAFAVYVGVEVTAGLWAFLLLTEGRGLPEAAAGICVSVYWGSLFVGRIVQGLVAERIGATRVLRGSLAAMAVGAGLVAFPAFGWLAVVGFAVIGFAAAPVFPLLTLTTADRVGRAHADRAIGLQTGASALGGALIPAGIGLLIGRLGVEAVGPALLAASLALLVLYVVSIRARPAAPHGG